MDTLHSFSLALLERLAWTSLQGAVLVGVLVVLMRLRPSWTPALRSRLWWLVSAQLLIGLAWGAPLSLPLLPPSSAPIEAPAAQTAVTEATSEWTHGPTGDLPATRDSGVLAITPHLDWHDALALAWMALVLLQLALAIRQGLRAHRLRTDAESCRDAALQTLCATQARRMGLRSVPQLRRSDAITSPQVGGWLRPTVLLPGHVALSREHVLLALRHELAHLCRGDLWLGLLPALAQRLFFFHPAAHWAAREYAIEREADCDARALTNSDIAPQVYGQLLLELGVSPRRHADLAGASPSFRQLKRRLTMLQSSPRSSHRLIQAALVLTVASAGLLPYRVTARTSAPAPATSTHVHAHTERRTRGAPVPAPPAPPASPAPPPAPPAPDTPPAPPAPPAPPSYGGRHFRNVSIATRDNSEQGLVLIDHDSLRVYGDHSDMSFAHDVAAGTTTATLWLRRGPQRYVTHDRTTIERVQKIYDQLTMTAQKESRLTARESELMGRESGLVAEEGALQGELASRQATWIRRQAQWQALTSADADTAPDGQRQAHERAIQAAQQDLHRDMDRLRARLAERRRAIDDKRHDIQAQRSAIAAQRTALSRQRLKATHQATLATQALLVEAFRQGKFKRLN